MLKRSHDHEPKTMVETNGIKPARSGVHKLFSLKDALVKTDAGTAAAKATEMLVALEQFKWINYLWMCIWFG
jgi:hypothetical protein